MDADTLLDFPFSSRGDRLPARDRPAAGGAGQAGPDGYRRTGAWARCQSSMAW